MQIIIVIPCYNEEDNLLKACQSFGFGISGQSIPNDPILIIVDNHSTDSTTKVANAIKEESTDGSVYVVFEGEQGYVPARHRGNLLAVTVANKLNLKIEDILILQADADTTYSNDYVDSMKAAALQYGHNFLFEACVSYPPDFLSNYASYFNLCAISDAKYQTLFDSINHDYIVDDKVSGYWLSDYMNWGQHQREFNAKGKEIFAETTRLFIRAQAKDAKRIWVHSAIAYHSGRKILKDYLFHFVTAGFPRELDWNADWKLQNEDRDVIIEPQIPLNTEIESAVLNCRNLHMIAIFYLLPFHVEHTLGIDTDHRYPEFAEFAHGLLPKRNVDDLLRSPGIFLTDVFEVINSQGGEILGEADKIDFEKSC